jgi:hypothetical protein
MTPTTTNRPTVAGRREELEARLASYLEGIDAALHRQARSLASAYAQAAQAVAATLAVLPVDKLEAAGELWTAPRTHTPNWLHMDAEDGER